MTGVMNSLTRARTPSANSVQSPSGTSSPTAAVTRGWSIPSRARTAKPSPIAAIASVKSVTISGVFIRSPYASIR